MTLTLTVTVNRNRNPNPNPNPNRDRNRNRNRNPNANANPNPNPNPNPAALLTSFLSYCEQHFCPTTYSIPDDTCALPLTTPAPWSATLSYRYSTPALPLPIFPICCHQHLGSAASIIHALLLLISHGSKSEKLHGGQMQNVHGVQMENLHGVQKENVQGAE